MMKKLIKYIQHPTKVVEFLQERCNFPVLPDALYLKICYKLAMGKKLDLKNPQTFSEKLQWLKLHDRKPEYTKLVDKYECKKIIAEKIGEEYVIPTLGVWDRFDDIDFDSLPQQFVLKCTHDSGSVILVRDKQELDISAAKRKLEKSLKKNYYYSGREWPYKNVTPRILAEERISEGAPDDYKFYMFQGEMDSVMVCTDRDSGNTQYRFYDRDWNRLYYQKPELEPAGDVGRPACFPEMIEIAEKLSKDFVHVRVDLYNVGEKVYFGELTMFDQSGFVPEYTDERNLIFGQKMDLHNI